MARQAVSELKKLIILMIGLLLLAYFVYHTVYGRKGLITEAQLQTRLEQKQMGLDAVERDRMAMERRVQGLKPESLDPDLLDEEARRQLGMSKPEEKVILTPEEDSSSGR